MNLLKMPCPAVLERKIILIAVGKGGMEQADWMWLSQAQQISEGSWCWTLGHRGESECPIPGGCSWPGVGQAVGHVVHRHSIKKSSSQLDQLFKGIITLQGFTKGMSIAG